MTSGRDDDAADADDEVEGGVFSDELLFANPMPTRDRAPSDKDDDEGGLLPWLTHRGISARTMILPSIICCGEGGPIVVVGCGNGVGAAEGGGLP